MVNSYFYKLVLSQLVLFHWSTRTFLQLVLWSTRTFSLVNSYFSLVNSYFFFGQLVLFEKNTYDTVSRFTETDRNGPKRTFVDTETDSLSTETDSPGTETDRNGPKRTGTDRNGLSWIPKRTL